MSETLFYDVWDIPNPHDRALLIAAKRKEAIRLAETAGFLSMRALESDDGRVIVEGRWASREAFEAAARQDDRARACRQALQPFGTVTPAVFVEAFRIRPFAVSRS